MEKLMQLMEKLEEFVETTLFWSRWLLAPLYLGLVVALFILLIKFVAKLGAIFFVIFSSTGPQLIFNILSLVDIVLVANLLLMIIFSGYENFVSKIDAVKGHVDKPEWMGKIDYSALKLKVIGSIVAISSIELLKAFIDIHNFPKEDIFWLVIIHLTFVTSGVLFALMERIGHLPHTEHAKKDEKTDDDHTDAAEEPVETVTINAAIHEK
jgi:uncharacterized protein (TIGR00645 family)